MTRWQHVFFGKDRPQLAIEDRGVEIAVGSANETTVLTGLRAKVYRLIQTPTTALKMLERLRGVGESGIDEGRVEREVGHLVEMGFAWRTNTSLINSQKMGPGLCKHGVFLMPSLVAPQIGSELQELVFKGLLDSIPRIRELIRLDLGQCHWLVIPRGANSPR